MVRLCFQRKNKTLGAIFKNKKVIEMLEENYKTFCSLNDKVRVYLCEMMCRFLRNVI